MGTFFDFLVFQSPSSQLGSFEGSQLSSAPPWGSGVPPNHTWTSPVARNALSVDFEKVTFLSIKKPFLCLKTALLKSTVFRRKNGFFMPKNVTFSKSMLGASLAAGLVQASFGGAPEPLGGAELSCEPSKLPSWELGD